MAADAMNIALFDGDERKLLREYFVERTEDGACRVWWDAGTRLVDGGAYVQQRGQAVVQNLAELLAERHCIAQGVLDRLMPRLSAEGLSIEDCKPLVDVSKYESRPCWAS